MPNVKGRIKGNRLTLTKQEIEFAEKLPLIPAVKRIQVDRRADKYKRRGK